MYYILTIIVIIITIMIIIITLICYLELWPNKTMFSTQKR